MRIRLALAAVILAALAAPAGAAATPILHLDGIGPLKLGMSRTSALATGWINNRTSGCPLGGPPMPIVYRLRGPRAPAGLAGSAEFRGGHLRNLSVTRGARTALGVTVGRTTVTRMVARYRAAGFAASARYDPTFQGTFVTVNRRGRSVLSAFATGAVISTLGVPYIPVCE